MYDRMVNRKEVKMAKAKAKEAPKKETTDSVDETITR